MGEALPQEKAEQVARDLQTLVAEESSKKPRKQWWQLSIEGLKKTAKDVGEIGKPVLELVAKIVLILVAISLQRSKTGISKRSISATIRLGYEPNAG